MGPQTTAKTLWLSFRMSEYTDKPTANKRLNYNTRAEALHAGDLIHVGLGLPDDAPREAVLKAARAEIEREFKPPPKKATKRQRVQETLGLIRQIIIALPRDISEEQQQEMMRRYVGSLTKDGQAIAIVGIHRDSDGADGEGNPHAHVMLMDRKESRERASERARARELATGKAARIRQEYTFQLFHGREGKKPVRRHWRDLANGFLAEVGAPVRLEVDSFRELGIDREPTVHLGPGRRRAATERREWMGKARPDPLVYTEKAEGLNRRLDEVGEREAEADHMHAQVTRMQIETQQQAKALAEREADAARVVEAERAERERAQAEREQADACARGAAAAAEEARRAAEQAEKARLEKESEARQAAEREAEERKRREMLEETIGAVCGMLGITEQQFELDGWDRLSSHQRAGKVWERIETVGREESRADHAQHVAVLASKNTRIAALKRRRDALKKENDILTLNVENLDRDNTTLREQLTKVKAVARHLRRIAILWYKTLEYRAQTATLKLLRAILPTQDLEMPATAERGFETLRVHLGTEDTDADARARRHAAAVREREHLAEERRAMDDERARIQQDAAKIQTLAEALEGKAHRYGGDIAKEIKVISDTAKEMEERQRAEREAYQRALREGRVIFVDASK